MTNEPRRVTAAELSRWSETLAALARTGLAFTDNLYEQERFEEVLHVAADIGAHMDAEIQADPHLAVTGWLEQVVSGVPGYVTPKVAVGALVGNDDQELLLIQRSDSGVWLYPTGWADVGYSPAEVIVKEVQEETGIDVVVDRLVAVVDGLRNGWSRIPFYSLVFQAHMVGGELAAHPLECSDLGFFTRDALPSPLASEGAWVDHAFDVLAGNVIEANFDLPRDPPWQG